MRLLETVINGTSLSWKQGSNTYNVPYGTSKYLEIGFAFSDEWGPLKKVVCFKSGNNELYMPIISNKCSIPDSITNGEVEFSFKVIGMNRDTKVLTNFLEVRQVNYE